MNCLEHSWHTRTEWPINIIRRQILCQICLSFLLGNNTIYDAGSNYRRQKLVKGNELHWPLTPQSVCQCLHLNFPERCSWSLLLWHSVIQIIFSHWSRKGKCWFPAHSQHFQNLETMFRPRTLCSLWIFTYIIFTKFRRFLSIVDSTVFSSISLPFWLRIVACGSNIKVLFFNLWIWCPMNVNDWNCIFHKLSAYWVWEVKFLFCRQLFHFPRHLFIKCAINNTPTTIWCLVHARIMTPLLLLYFTGCFGNLLFLLPICSPALPICRYQH